MPSVTGTGTVTVDNVAPEIEIQVIDPANPGVPGGVTAQGTGIVLRIVIADPGVFDSHFLHIAWGDGEENDYTLTPQQLSNGYIDVVYHYPALPAGNQTQSYQIDVTVVDDDGGTATASAPVVVGTVSSGEKPEVSVTRIDDASEIGFVRGHFRVSRTGPTTSSLSVKLAFSGEAKWKNYELNHQTDEYDYTMTKVNTYWRTVTIPAGADHIDVDIIPAFDTIKEGSEDVIVTVLPRSFVLPQYDISSTNGTATISIADAYGTLTISPLEGDSIEEDDNGRLGFQIVSGGGISSASLTVTGTATFGSPWTTFAGRNGHSGVQDYFIDDGYLLSYPNLSLLSLESGVKNLYVYPLHDGHVEDDETVILKATSVSTSADVTGPITSNTITLEITNDDSPATVSVTAESSSIAEAESESTRFVISRSGPTTYPLSVNLRLEGTATLGIDYVFGQQNGPYSGVTFGEGQATFHVAVQAKQDRAIEPSESIKLVLNSGADYTVNTEGGTSTITIVDDDTPGGNFVFVRGSDSTLHLPEYSDWIIVTEHNLLGQVTAAYWLRYKQVRQYELAGPAYESVPGDPHPNLNASFQLSETNTMSWSLGVSKVVTASGSTSRSWTQAAGGSVGPGALDPLPANQFYRLYGLDLKAYVLEQRVYAPIPNPPGSGSGRPFDLPASEIDGASGDKYVEMTSISKDALNRDRVIFEAGSYTLYKFVPAE